MKKIRLRKWTKAFLLIIAFISFIVACCECNDTKTFIIKSVISMTTFITSTMILLVFQDNKD